MSERKVSINGGGSGFGLTGLIGGIVAWCSTPSFVGWAGAGKAALVGAGTSIGATIVAIPCAIAGALFGGAIGLLTRSKGAALFGAIGFGAIGGIGGGIYGAVEGYGFAKSALTECAPAKTAFNDNAAQHKQAFTKPAAALKVQAPRLG
jgi:hypothetical protein